MAKARNRSRSSATAAAAAKPTKASAKPPPYIICPTTGDKIWITTATLSDLKRAAKTGECPNSKKKQLVRISSPAERVKRYQEAAAAMEAIEQTLLPPYGGRSWKVTCRITEPNNTRQKPPLFRWFRGQLELACLPHLLEKIPERQRFKGDWAYLDNTANEEHDEPKKTSLQERAVSSISTAAWSDRDHAIPTITLKWLSPNHTYFYSRKAAWDHATLLAEQDVFLDKILWGVGARGQTLRPTKVSKTVALKAGKLRFLRDGLWIVGQEEAWQEQRAAEILSEQQQRQEQNIVKVEERLEEVATAAAPRSQQQPSSSPEHDVTNVASIRNNTDSLCFDIEYSQSNHSQDTQSASPASPPSLPPIAKQRPRSVTGLVYYLRCNREQYRANKLLLQESIEQQQQQQASRDGDGDNKMQSNNSRFTLRDAETELRVHWKNLSEDERQSWNDRARDFEASQALSCDSSPPSPSSSCSKEKVVASSADSKQEARRFAPGLFHFIACNRDQHRAKRQAEQQQQQQEQHPPYDLDNHVLNRPPRLPRFTLKDADKELRLIWKDLSQAEKVEWHVKAQAAVARETDPFSGKRAAVDAVVDDAHGRVTPSESSGDENPTPVASLTTEEHGVNLSNDMSSTSACEQSEGKVMSVALINSNHDCVDGTDDVYPCVSVPIPVTESPRSSSSLSQPMANPQQVVVSSSRDTLNASIINNKADAPVDTKHRRLLAACPPRRVVQSSHWRMLPQHVDLCYRAAMDHYERVMHTVKSRDLLRELEDGFDVLRERGRGRFDMELPEFDTCAFDFLTDLQKAPWMPVVREILGDEVALIHKGVFLSLPGAEPQVYHQDGLHLTTQTQRPCHAINVFIPLVDLSLRNGPTQFCVGSHILGHEDYDKDFLVTPTPTKGTPIIFDYRLGHRGLGNTSSTCRPVVYCTYAAAADGKEFRDSANFSRKRYRKIGELIDRPLSREERRQKRQCIEEQREIEEALAVMASNEPSAHDEQPAKDDTIQVHHGEEALSVRASVKPSSSASDGPPMK